VPDTGTDEPLDPAAPDFSVAGITSDSGVVARLIGSMIGTHDHGRRNFGGEGVLGTKDCWYDRSPVWMRRPVQLRRRMPMSPWKIRYPLGGDGRGRYRYRGARRMDFARGEAERAASIGEDRPTPPSGRYGLHANEMAIAIDRDRRPVHHHDDIRADRDRRAGAGRAPDGGLHP
jgi:hypothetical protein